MALIRMKSGRTIQMEVSWAAAIEQHDINGVQLLGTEAGATTNPARLFRSGPDGYESVELKPTTALVNDNRMAHFVDVVLGRAKPFVTPEQLGGTVAFLCSPAADQITGTTVAIDGAWTAQ